MQPLVLVITEGARAFARRKLGDAPGSLEAAECLLSHTLRVGASAGNTLICVPASTGLAIQLTREGRPFLKQVSGTLGARVAAALGGARELAAEGQPVIILWDDCPGLTEEHLAEAVEAFQHGAETLVGRARDGGFWLLGLARWDAALCQSLAVNVEWRTPRAFTSLRRFLHANFAGTMGLLSELSDLDTPADLGEAVRAAETTELKTLLAAVRPGRALLRADDELTLAPRGEHGVAALFKSTPRA
jgi:glycosyltransferase A (GT-A) superfamily protein (DUF2064 family)